MDIPPNMDMWQPEGLRLTAFFPESSADVTVESNWWNQLAGRAPDSITTRPTARTTHVHGRIHDDKLVLTLDSQPGRIDWRLALAIDAETEIRSLPTMESTSESLDVFSKLMLTWLDTSPSLRRLALGTVFLQPMADRVAGYRQIATYLPKIELDPENSSDFNYTINRPRPSTSGIDNLVINRLSKWAVVHLRRVQVYISAPEGAIPETVTPAADLHGCRLEIDVNSSPKFEGELPHDRLPALYNELVNLSIEIASKGDIR